MAKFKKSDYKKHKNLYSIMGKLGDIIFYPVIILTLVCCVVIFSSKDQHRVPTILGFSLVTILSESMVAAGFDVDDNVFTFKVNPAKLRVGDIIAFYYTNPCQGRDSLNLIQSYDMSTHQVVKEFDSETFNELRAKTRIIKTPNVAKISKSTDIYFHRIISIYIANDGTLFFETEGDSNHGKSGYDNFLTAENCVVGKYVYTPQVVRSTLQFVATPTGMIVTVVGPLCLLSLFMLFSIIEQVSRLSVERRVLRRELRYDDPESIKANIGIEMEVSDKAKFYATSEDDEKNAVANFLWGYLSVDSRQQLTYHGIMNNLKHLETDPNQYWLYFLGSTKSKRERKLIHKAWTEWMAEEKVKEIRKRHKKVQQQVEEKKGVKIEGKRAPQRPKRSE